MMLQALIAYADREKLGDPDFKKMPVRWEIALDGRGGFIVIPRLKDPDAKMKQPRQVVRPFTRNDDIGHGKSHFLCDIQERALGMMPENATASAAANRARQFAYFKGLLRRAAEACPQSKSLLEVVLTSLETPDALKAMQEAMRDANSKSSDTVTFSVANKSLLDIPELKAFWQSFRRGTVGASAVIGRGPKRPKTSALTMCLATGHLTQPVKTAGKIRGVPNTQGGSANLIAFDKDAFTSYGLKKAFNAAISPDADVKICSALDDLIEKGTLIPQRVKNVNKSKQVVYVHWTREPDEDPFDLLETADEAVVAEFLRSPIKGTPPGGLNSNKYYLLSLSGNISRIIVRDWLVSSVSEVKANVRDWFDHLTIMRERDGGFRSNHKIVALLYGLVRESLEELPPHIHTQLFSAALRGAQLPQSILAAALRRQQIEPDSNERDPAERAKRKATINARLALIKLYLVRNHSADPLEQKVMSDKLKQLDPTSTDIAYLCGQLFAVIGRLQLLALGKVGTSLAERTYGGVATRPASTLGPIFTKVPAYLKKANSRFPGAGTNKQTEIATLCARIDAVDKAESRLGFPPFLGLEEQGRFALGYYCQLAQYRADRIEAEIEKEAEELPDDSE
jgi:CRISPR-associated protein Csd1